MWQSLDERRVSAKFISDSQWERYHISTEYLEKYGGIFGCHGDCGGGGDAPLAFGG